MRTVDGQKTLYTECQNKVERLQNVLEATLVHGIPVSRACKRENINYLWFMRFVKQNIDASEGSEKDRVTVTQKDWETWREDFLRDLTGKETMVPADFDEVYAQLVTELDDVEREVLQLRYQEGLSLREIAEHKHLSSERIRQILAKTMRKFRHPRYRWQLCLGVKYSQVLEGLHSAQAEYDRAVAAKESELQYLLNEKIKELSKEAEDIRAEVAFTQAMKETGFLQFGGDVSIEQFNFAGIGTTGGGVPGNSYPDVRTGVRAQIQHLKAYATDEALAGECVDDRYSYVTKGSAPYVEWLGQKENPEGYGWATGERYGYDIVEMIHAMRK